FLDAVTHGNNLGRSHTGMAQHVRMARRQLLGNKTLGGIESSFLIVVHRDKQVSGDIEIIRISPGAGEPFFDDRHRVSNELRGARIVEQDAVGILAGKPKHLGACGADIHRDFAAGLEIEPAARRYDVESITMKLELLAGQDASDDLNRLFAELERST